MARHLRKQNAYHGVRVFANDRKDRKFVSLYELTNRAIRYHDSGLRTADSYRKSLEYRGMTEHVSSMHDEERHRYFSTRIFFDPSDLAGDTHT